MRRLVSVLLLATALPAVADDFYLSVGAGLAVFDDTASTSNAPFPQPGQRVIPSSVNGQRFDSNESAIELGVGWQIRDWIALELAYTDFGNAGQNADGILFQLPTTLTPPQITPGVSLIPPPSNGFGFVGATLPPPFTSALGVETWSINARFRKPLFAGFSATWNAGISRAEFDAEGSISLLQIVDVDPLVTQETSVVYQNPGSETGFRYGFGVEWTFNDRFAFDLGYQRHDTRVIDLETVMVKIIVSL